MRAEWNNLFRTVARALDLEPSARKAFVAHSCGDDMDLRREVDALLDVCQSTEDLAVARGLVETELFGVRERTGVTASPGLLAVGTIIDGKYRIDEVIGSGGMGAVYRATHLQMERTVALKAIRGELLSDAILVERFRREAIAVARLRHPHIVTVHDYGIAPDGGAYIVLELLEGHTLRQELILRGQFDVPDAMAIMSQIVSAVGMAHRAGVIHRDLKPENIFVEHHQGALMVKVVDFGLARLDPTLLSSHLTLTRGGEVLGTPAYMSPEQCRGEEADERSDLYSLGCVLFEMLTGRRLFNGKTVWALIYQHVNDEPQRPGDIAQGVPPEIDEALLRALAKDPAARYRTVEDFAVALGIPEIVPMPVSISPGSSESLLARNVGTEAGPVRRTPSRPRSPNNLPHAVTRFVGRAREINEVRHWLASVRLVTLVGPGGIGKTRLALETALQVLGGYPDGVWFIELAPLADPELIPQAAGSALGLRGQGGQIDIESIETWLRDRRALLVLDNCEHMVDACASFAERLLGGCEELQILATSRESLNLPGEAAWPVPALTVPSTTSTELLDNEAVRLFVDRASLAKPGFVVDERIAPAIAELCRRLEGIPLALELAAARVKTLTVGQILDRLSDRFRLLASGNRNTPTRQQTLRAALDWSYDLLTPDERIMFEWLSVFAGGWTLETAEALVDDRNRRPENAPPSRLQVEDVLDLVSRLVDKSLVAVQGQTQAGRYRFLEIVREYAAERLRESGAVEDAARRHAAVFRAMAELGGTGFVGSREVELLEQLETEHDNMRAALGWLLEHDPDDCLHMTVALAGFWSLRGHFAEGLRWMTVAVEASDPTPTQARVVAIRSIGECAWRMGRLDVARTHLEDSLRMARVVGDKRQISWSTFHLALVLQQQDDARASCPYLEESLQLGRELGDDRLIGNALNSLGEAARIEGDWAAARPFYEQSLEIHQALGHPVGVSVTLCNLGAVLYDAGEIDAARERYLEALPALRDLGNTIGLSLALDGFGAVAAGRGEWERAARFAGAADALRDASGGALEPADRSLRERYLEQVREHLDDRTFEDTLAEGRTAGRERAIEDALAM